MEYKQLGKFGVKVSELCLGTGFRGNSPEDVHQKTVHRALELGCNFVDCANSYGAGRSETILGRALKGRRDDVVLTSKVHSKTGDGPNNIGLSRYHIMREVERSLKRLQTDRIDIYLQHAMDVETPLEETLRAMDDLIRQGKVIYAGSCNNPAWRLMEQIGICNASGLAPMAVAQNAYNLLERFPVEFDLMQVARNQGLGLMTYSPLAVGMLTGKFRKDVDPPADSVWAGRRSQFHEYMTGHAEGVIVKLIEVAEKLGKTPAQVAIAWVLDHPDVTSAIIGPDLPEQVEDAFGGIGWKLDAEDRQALDLVSAVQIPGPIR